VHIHLCVTFKFLKSQPSDDVDSRMIILECFQRQKSSIHGPFLVIVIIKVLPLSPRRLRKLALGDVVLDNSFDGVVFSDAVPDTLKDNLDPTVEGCQVGLPQHWSHRIPAHGVAHRFTQLTWAVVEPVEIKSQSIRDTILSPSVMSIILFQLQALKLLLPYSCHTSLRHSFLMLWSFILTFYRCINICCSQLFPNIFIIFMIRHSVSCDREDSFLSSLFLSFVV